MDEGELCITFWDTIILTCLLGILLNLNVLYVELLFCYGFCERTGITAKHDYS